MWIVPYPPFYGLIYNKGAAHPFNRVYPTAQAALTHIHPIHPRTSVYNQIMQGLRIYRIHCAEMLNPCH
jgi:hypothetical protein